jgi:hypothetical protein
MKSLKKHKKYKNKTHKNKPNCHYSHAEMLQHILPLYSPSEIHPKIQKLRNLVNCVIRSDEVLGYYLNLIHNNPFFSTAPRLQIYRKLSPEDTLEMGPPNGFMHGLYYDSKHWHYVFHGHPIDSYQQEHQIPQSDNFCSTFALMYLLETHNMRAHYPLRKKAFYHNIRVACQFWLDELRIPELKTIFEKRLRKTLGPEMNFQDALQLFQWGKHHAEEFYLPFNKKH